MKNSLKVFVKDYIKLCKQTNRWMAKHWKGYLVLCGIAGLGTYAYLRLQTRKTDNEWHKALGELENELIEKS